MAKVKLTRYDIGPELDGHGRTVLGGVDMAPHPDGEWVRWMDVERLVIVGYKQPHNDSACQCTNSNTAIGFCAECERCQYSLPCLVTGVWWEDRK